MKGFKTGNATKGVSQFGGGSNKKIPLKKGNASKGVSQFGGKKSTK